MTFSWISEPSPTWDASKEAAFTPAGPAAYGLGTPADGEPLGDAWWRVEVDGAVAGFGRLDDSWGDAEILVVVVPAFRGSGVGGFTMESLEREAAARSLNYVYNVVPLAHPEREAVTSWLAAQGFADTGSGELRKRVTTRAATTAPSQ